MPPVSKINKLSPEVRREIEREIVKRNFVSMAALAADLASRGIYVTEQNLSAHGSLIRENPAVFDQVCSAMQAQDGADQMRIELNLRCLDLALRTPGATDFFKTAQSYLTWAKKLNG